jgi:hypothetical protein
MTTSSSVSRTLVALVGGLTLVATPALSRAQEASSVSPWEVRVSSGTLLPTGDERDVLKNAPMTALQVSRLMTPSLALTGTIGWARSQVINTTDTPKLDVFTSDLGIELRSPRWFNKSMVTFDAFAGVGGGMRSYNYRKLDVGATHNLAGYGAVGGEFGMGRVGLRLEVRDYLTGFKPLVGAGESGMRNDVVFTAAVRFNRNRAPKN